MLSAKDNETLTRVGRGTPMGELMRRYWQPVAAVAQLDESPTLPVRLLGEDLVLYRDLQGRYGLLDRHCAHRRADLSYGIVEACGLRCNYHGWLYDGDGACLEQPFEDVARARRRASRTRSGWRRTRWRPRPACCGPTSGRRRRRWCRTGTSTTTTATSRSCSPRSPATGSRARRTPSTRSTSSGCTPTGPPPSAASPRAPRHLKIAFEEFEWGFTYRRVREDTTEDDELWTVGRVCLWPNCLYTGKFEWRVPIDDERTLHVAWFNDPVPGPRAVRADADPVLARPDRRSRRPGAGSPATS